MQSVFRVDQILEKVIDNSFFVNTPYGKVRVVSGDLVCHPGKYFYLKDVIYAILHLYKFYDMQTIDLADLHDMLYASYISNKEILTAIETQNSKT